MSMQVTSTTGIPPGPTPMGKSKAAETTETRQTSPENKADVSGATTSNQDQFTKSTEKDEPEKAAKKESAENDRKTPPTSVSTEDIRKNVIAEQHDSMSEEIISNTEKAFEHDEDRLIPAGIGGSDH